ncbi:putative histidine triad (HIT) family protein [Pillotina sp. SPG140]
MPVRKIYEDADMVAFYDAQPQAPVHSLVIPRRHIATIMETNEEDVELLGKLLFKAQQLAVELGCEEKGARFVINCKEYGGQTVDHLHIHILGGRPFDWPPG